MMNLKDSFLIGLVALLTSSVNSLAAIGITTIPSGTTATDTGSHLTVVFTAFDGDLDTDNDPQDAQLPAGLTVTDWSFFNEVSGVSAEVTPLIFTATGGGEYDVVTIGTSAAPGAGLFTGTFTPDPGIVGNGSATIPGTGSYYAGFYMRVPNTDTGGNHAPIGFVGELGGGDDDSGEIAFDNTTVGAPGLGAINVHDSIPTLARTYNFSVTVPEPSSAMLGLVGFCLFLRRRR